jgi:hypothetical protein
LFPYWRNAVSVDSEKHLALQQQIVTGIQHRRKTTIDRQKKGPVPGMAKSGSNGSGTKYDHRSRQNTVKEATTGNTKKKLRTRLSPTVLSQLLKRVATFALEGSRLSND